MDRLIEKIKKTKCPVCAGLDTSIDYIPGLKLAGDPLDYAAKAIRDYNFELIDVLCDIVPAVKVQIAYYEMYGTAGMQTFLDTIRYAKKKGLFVITDAKRGDIGATAKAYSAAHIGKTQVLEQTACAFPADMVTVNAYLGTDGVKPFLEDMKTGDKGIFVLVKTLNPSSGELQDLVSNGKRIYEHMADLCEQWGKPFIGKYGYSAVGAVVGATYPGQMGSLRAEHKNMFFLVPGYGAQGGTAKDIVPAFDAKGLGGIVNNSRGIIAAHQREAYAGMKPKHAAKEAALLMKEDILNAFDDAGIRL